MLIPHNTVIVAAERQMEKYYAETTNKPQTQILCGKTKLKLKLSFVLLLKSVYMADWPFLLRFLFNSIFLSC